MGSSCTDKLSPFIMAGYPVTLSAAGEFLFLTAYLLNLFH